MKCTFCSRNLAKHKTQYCSAMCESKFQSIIIADRVCIICNTSMGPRRSTDTATTCSNTCRGLLRRQTAREIRQCGVCATEFTTYKKSAKQYCSTACRLIVGRRTETNQRRIQSINTANITKYGVPWWSSLPDSKQKLSHILRTKYTDDSEKAKLIDAIAQTKLRRYGDKNYNNTEKTKETSLKKYGVDNFNKTDVFRYRFFQKTMSRIAHAVQPRFSFDAYTGVTDAIYPFTCMMCNNTFTDHLDNGRFPRCPSCYPIKSVSVQEKEVVSFIRSITSSPLIENDRRFLDGTEVDILLPDHQLAIEYNGIYGHSELNGKNRLYHVHKTQLCESKNTRLIQIFQTEWEHTPHIVKSILTKYINPRLLTTISARSSVVVEISKMDADTFLTAHHLQGVDQSSVRYGLYHTNELVAVMTFVKPRYNKLYEWELSRFVTKTNYTVRGGASKLFSHFVTSHQPNSIITYSDRRWFSGEVYRTMGFVCDGYTHPNYFYFKRSDRLEHRLAYQKHKLQAKFPDTYHESLSEWGNLQRAGYDRIWDCGHRRFVWTPA